MLGACAALCAAPREPKLICVKCDGSGDVSVSTDDSFLTIAWCLATRCTPSAAYAAVSPCSRSAPVAVATSAAPRVDGSSSVAAFAIGLPTASARRTTGSRFTVPSVLAFAPAQVAAKKRIEFLTRQRGRKPIEPTLLSHQPGSIRERAPGCACKRTADADSPNAQRGDLLHREPAGRSNQQIDWLRPQRPLRPRLSRWQGRRSSPSPQRRAQSRCRSRHSRASRLPRRSAAGASARRPAASRHPGSLETRRGRNSS